VVLTAGVLGMVVLVASGLGLTVTLDTVVTGCLTRTFLATTFLAAGFFTAAVTTTALDAGLACTAFADAGFGACSGAVAGPAGKKGVDGTAGHDPVGTTDAAGPVAGAEVSGSA